MPTRKPTDVSLDVRSVEAIRAAFEREDLHLPPWDPEAPLTLSSPEEHAATKKFTSFVSACIEALFGRAVADRPRAFDEWSPEQRALLTEVAKLPAAALVNGGDLSEWLVAVGAMTIEADDPRYLLRYVGLVPPGVLERSVSGRPLWLWLRLRLMGLETPEALLEATAALDDAERMALCRLATENAYQLLRRFPMPDEITHDQEATDTGRLFDALLPVLALASDAFVERVLADEIGKPHPSSALVVLLVHTLVDRGLPIDERVDAALAEELPLYPVHGRPLLARFPASRVAAMVARMEPVAHNPRGFWTYADLLEPAERAERVAAALAGFTRPCKASVAERVTALVRGLPVSARARLEAIASGTGPNAKVVAAALRG